MSPAKLIESGVVSNETYAQNIRSRSIIDLYAKNIYLYSEAYKQALEQGNQETANLLKQSVDQFVQKGNRQYGEGSFPSFSPSN